MSIPVINTTQSVLGYLQGEYFEFLPYASGMGLPAGKTVTSITLASQTATVTCAAHGFSNGDSIRILGPDQPEYVGDFVIFNVALNTFDFTVAGSPATPATVAAGSMMAFKGTPSWSCTAIPAGIALDPWTGLLSGASIVPGVFVIAMTARNTDGASLAVVFTLGIEAANGSLTSSVVDLGVDLDTFLVSSLATKQDGDPLLWAKLNDKRILRVRFKRSGVNCNLTLSALNLAVKEFEPDGILCASSAWVKVNNVNDVHYLVYIEFIGTNLKGELSNYEEDAATQFKGLGELEWLEINPTSPLLGSSPLRSASRTFPVELSRDLNP